MNKYVVAFWNDHTGELLQELVEAHSQLEAGIKYLNIEEEFLPTSLTELISYCVNGDSMINILDLSKFSTIRGSKQGTLYSVEVPNIPLH